YITNDYIGDNSNSYTWNVPSMSSDNFRFKVSGYHHASVKDSSDADFSVGYGPNYLTLTYPNGSETIPSSTIQTITWNNTGTIGNVSLRFSKDGGANWEWVKNKDGSNANNVPNTGSYDWLVPANIVASRCLIQIYEYSRTCVVDVSDSVFAVNNNPGITVTFPNGGENIYAGRSYSINWSSSNLPTNY